MAIIQVHKHTLHKLYKTVTLLRSVSSSLQGIMIIKWLLKHRNCSAITVKRKTEISLAIK